MDRVVFRMSPLGVLGAIALAVCATPVALGAPWLFLVYLVPLGIAAWVLRTGTVIDQETVTVRSLLARRRVPWDHITSLRLRKKASLGGKAMVSAVLTDGVELPLPAVRVRDLSVLAAVSGGRLPDPAAANSDDGSSHADNADSDNTDGARE